MKFLTPHPQSLFTSSKKKWWTGFYSIKKNLKLGSKLGSKKDGGWSKTWSKNGELKEEIMKKRCLLCFVVYYPIVVQFFYKTVTTNNDVNTWQAQYIFSDFHSYFTTKIFSWMQLCIHPNIFPYIFFSFSFNVCWVFFRVATSFFTAWSFGWSFWTTNKSFKAKSRFCFPAWAWPRLYLA